EDDLVAPVAVAWHLLEGLEVQRHRIGRRAEQPGQTRAAADPPGVERAAIVDWQRVHGLDRLETGHPLEPRGQVPTLGGTLHVAHRSPRWRGAAHNLEAATRPTTPMLSRGDRRASMTGVTLATTLDVRPLSPIIGAEIGGLDLARPLGDATVAGVR